jgi:hypothetical protein
METRPKYLLAALTLACAAACATSPDDTEVVDSGIRPSGMPGGGTSDAGAGGSASGTISPGSTTGGGSSDAGSSGSAGGSSPAGTGGAAGGTDAGASAGGGGTTADCTGDVPTNNDDLVTNFEDGTVGVNAVTGRGGGFYIFNDKMNDKVAQTFAVAANNRCSDGSSQYAFCSKGGGFMVWGAGFGTDLGVTDPATMKKTTVDLSAYTGISFWVIRNSGMAATAKLIVADKNTAEEGANCTNMSGAMDKDKCDPYVANVPLSNKWTKQTIKFASLKQGGWGKPSPMFAANAVYGIQLQFAQLIDFDVCFDQLVLVR